MKVRMPRVPASLTETDSQWSWLYQLTSLRNHKLLPQQHFEEVYGNFLLDLVNGPEQPQILRIQPEPLICRVNELLFFKLVSFYA